MNIITIALTAALVLVVLGLFIAGAGLVALRRGKTPGRGLCQLVLGLAAVGAAGATAWHYRQSVEQFFLEDADPDPEARAALQNAQLEAASLPAASGIEAEDWPQWRGPLRDGISRAKGLLKDWPAAGPPVAWRQSIKGGYSSVAVAGGLLYVTDRDGTQERVLCLEAATGKELWVHRYEADYRKLSGGNSYGAGPRATPTVADGRVYTVGATGIFLCLEARPVGGQPTVFWQHDLLAEFDARLPNWGVACSPLVEGNLVCVQPGGDKGSVAAFDRISGERVWTALSDVSGYSSPVAVTAAGVRQIICFTGKRVAGLRAGDGQLLWDFAWSTPYDCNVATPIIADDYVFISSDYSSGCALLQLSPDGQGVQAKRVFVRRNKLMRNQFSTSVLVDGHLYGFDVSGHGGQGALKCVDLRTFEEKWAARDLRDKGCLLYAGGQLLVLTEGGELALVDATPEAFHKKAQVRVLDGSDCWAAPALAAGRLYLRSNRELVCLDLRSK